MDSDKRITLIIPALNEQETIGAVVSGIDRRAIHDVIVVDNGSTDHTADVAQSSGARVVYEPHQGYGQACQAGVCASNPSYAIAFMDADGSDDPQDLLRLISALDRRNADLIIGSRVLGSAEKGSLTFLQRFGNMLTCHLVKLFWAIDYTDLGPLRVIRTDALQLLNMTDPDFGWTIEMQVKAAQKGLRTHEIPVNYRRRKAGKSKVSGTLKGSYRAGKRILGYVFSAKLEECSEKFADVFSR